MEQQSDECPAEALDSEDILFMLYTSGSTGRPKGLVHTQAGYLLYTGMTHQVTSTMRASLLSWLLSCLTIKYKNTYFTIHK